MAIGQSKKHVIQLHWNQVTHSQKEFRRILNNFFILTNAKMMKLRISKLM